MNVALALLLVPLAGTAPAPDHKPQPFAAVVEANFARWDSNHDGKLTAVEVDKAVGDHAVTGDAAAAVAAVHVRFRSANPPAALTKADLLAAAAHPAAEVRRDKDQAKAAFTSYPSYARHVASAPRKLFTGPGAPTLEGMAQGHLGDCYFVSAVGAAVHRNPQAVRRTFREHPDGSVEVVFPNGRSARVGRLTDAEIALGSTAGPQGAWLNVLEKAFGELKIDTPRSKDRRAGDIDLDVIARGGDADETIALLTGFKANFGPIRKGHGTPPPDHELPALQVRLHNLLHAAATQHALVCAGTSHTGKSPPGVVSGHDYAVLGYDAGTKTVHVWNPWGQGYNFEPKGGPPGLDHGYEVKAGRFDVPLHDFVRIYEGVYYETRLPAGRK